MRVRIAFALVTTFATLARAQNPLWTLDASRGSGRHNVSAGEVWYFARAVDVWSVAASARLGRDARSAPYLKLEGSGGNDDLLSFMCATSPNGTCRRKFAGNAGIAASFGLRHALASRLSIGAGVGAGVYDEARGFVDVEASLRLSRHVGILTSARYMRWTQSGYPHWFAPISIGLRAMSSE